MRVSPHVENIVMTKDRSSHLAIVKYEDPAYVVGNYCDIRGVIVNTTDTRFSKSEIALRIKIGPEYSTQLPGHSEVGFDHHTKDYVGL